MQKDSSLRGYLSLLRRRRALIALATVLVPAVAVLASLQQNTLYRASASVLLARQSLANALNNTPDPSTQQQAFEQLRRTQAALARIPRVADAAVRMARADLTSKEFLAASSVEANADTDLLTFSVTDADAVTAQRLSTAYGQAYTEYRRRLDTASLDSALSELQAALTEAGKTGSTRLTEDLRNKEQQLRTLRALQVSNATLVRPAQNAVQVQPKPLRNAVIGLALGLMLGVAAALLRDALDSRIRTADQVAEILQMPLLARIPAPPRDSALVMLENPSGIASEAFRILRANLEFSLVGSDVRQIAISSAIESEGKSTTISNLAIAMARSGQRVVLVDLDLRRPILSRLFQLDGRPGLTQVILGSVSLQDALSPIHFGGDSPVRGEGSLHVLTSGPIPPAPGEFVNLPGVHRLLAGLDAHADIVLVDTPPLTRVGDAMTLAPAVDALLVVTRLGVIRRPILSELRRILGTAPTQSLGFIATGAEHEDGYGYGYGYGYADEPAGVAPGQLTAR